MRRAIRHGAVIVCDIDKCANTFVTYSMGSLARKQAAFLGWSRVKLNMLADWKELELGSDGRKKLDACQRCTADVTRAHAKRQEDKAIAKAAKRTPKMSADQPAPASPAPS